MATSTPQAFTGEVVYLFAVDVAYELKRPIPGTLLGQPLLPHQVGPAKRSPKQHLFQHLRAARLEPVKMAAPSGEVMVQRMVKVLPIGAVSIMLRVPFANLQLEQLGAFDSPAFAQEVIHKHLVSLAKSIHDELAPYAVRPAAALPEGEAYTVFCLETPKAKEQGVSTPFDAEAWFEANRRYIAAILTQEPDGNLLSQQEAEESTSQFLSYYRTDLVVVDWDAALVMDQPADMDETLHVLELANLQLEELIAYDRLLDAALERAYADLLRPPKHLSRHVLMSRLREVRIDLARFSDELSNITKFFGDWHLARLYDAVSRRFHLADWHHTIDDKLKTLDELYEMLKQEQNHRLMVFLEAAIVLMFLIDIIALFGGFGK
jgi:hypothetical protein